MRKILVQSAGEKEELPSTKKPRTNQAHNTASSAAISIPSLLSPAPQSSEAFSALSALAAVASCALKV